MSGSDNYLGNIDEIGKVVGRACIQTRLPAVNDADDAVTVHIPRVCPPLEVPHQLWHNVLERMQDYQEKLQKLSSWMNSCAVATWGLSNLQQSDVVGDIEDGAQREWKNRLYMNEEGSSSQFKSNQEELAKAVLKQSMIS